MSQFGIGERIKKLREINKLTQVDIASKLNISHQSISKWEREDSTPETSMIIELSKLFNVSTDYLLLGKTEHSTLNESSDKEILKVKSIGELTHEELLALFSTELVSELQNSKISILQSKGFISKSENPEWTIEGKQLSDKYLYDCCEFILKEMNSSDNIDGVYLDVNKRIDIPRELFNQFLDHLVSIGKITRISSYLR